MPTQKLFSFNVFLKKYKLDMYGIFDADDNDYLYLYAKIEINRSLSDHDIWWMKKKTIQTHT